MFFFCLPHVQQCLSRSNNTTPAPSANEIYQRPDRFLWGPLPPWGPPPSPSTLLRAPSPPWTCKGPFLGPVRAPRPFPATVGIFRGRVFLYKKSMQNPLPESAYMRREIDAFLYVVQLDRMWLFSSENKTIFYYSPIGKKGLYIFPPPPPSLRCIIELYKIFFL